MSNHANSFRPEIQGLRAVAVLVVLVFHIWPTAIPGGYVGVDVFFVISGFLITGLLQKEFEATGTISLRRFYQRRILRLLPAALVVLAVVAVLTPLLPRVRWQESYVEIAASSLYLQNWWLAYKATDYFAADAAAGPLQHFWSLAVEEQYYIVWPLVLLALASLGGSWGTGRRRGMLVLISAIGFISLAFSIYQTKVDPGVAYFSTFTRAWELALGGLLALTTPEWSRLSDRWKAVAGVVGLVCILLASFLYSGATAFPGYAALLPTAGAALVLIGRGAGGRYSPVAVLMTAPAQYFGRISYSLYLWHWPVVVFIAAIAGRPANPLEGFFILLVSVALAHQSATLVEETFRHPRSGDAKSAQPFVLAFASALVAVVGVVVMVGNPLRQVEPTPVVVDALHPGGAVLTHSVKAESDIAFVPTIDKARADKSPTRCIASSNRADGVTCSYGEGRPGPHVVIVGDSHMFQWLPAFEAMSARADFRVTVLSKSACAVGTIRVRARRNGDEYLTCTEWNRHLLDRLLALSPDIVVFSQSRGHVRLVLSDTPLDEAGAASALADSLVEVWRRLSEAGIRVAAIRDTPWVGIDVPDCMSRRDVDHAACTAQRQRALLLADPVLLAAERMGGVHVADMTDAICLADTCPPVIGNVLVWRDPHHLTATYATSLVPELLRQLQPVLDSVARPELASIEKPTGSLAVDFSGYTLSLDRPGEIVFSRIGKTRSDDVQDQMLLALGSINEGDALRSVRAAFEASGFSEERAGADLGGIRIHFRAVDGRVVAALVRKGGVGPAIPNPDRRTSVYLSTMRPADPGSSVTGDSTGVESR